MNIGGFGFELYLTASQTFPAGFSITQFADDADPYDNPSIQLRDKAMGLNGDLITWGKAQPNLITISVIPGSDDDLNLQAIADANKVGKGRFPVDDLITIVGFYPDGSAINLQNGTMTDAPMSNSVASAGRLKSKTYGFAFEAIE